MHEVLRRQLALDYCCSPEDVTDSRHHFSVLRPLEGQRRFKDDETCPLKVAAVNGKLLFAGRTDVITYCRDHYEKTPGEWFMEGSQIAELDEALRAFGCRVRAAHPFFIRTAPESVPELPFEVRWFEGEEILQFRGDGRFGNAYAFQTFAPDMLGAAALRGGKMIAMAGASADSPFLWQIGIDVLPEARGLGIAPWLTAQLANAVLERGRVPFYGTALSHIASQRTALRAGFLPAWAELIAGEERVPKTCAGHGE